MPKAPPANDYYEISCYSQPAREVSGDYFDFINHDCSKGKTYVVIGDISGKGMAAALHMVQVQAILHYLVENNESPKTIISLLNKNLKKVLRKGSYFTVQEYGEERFKSVILKNVDKSAKEMQEAILDNISSFMGPSPAHDDLTLIIMKYI